MQEEKGGLDGYLYINLRIWPAGRFLYFMFFGL